MTKLFNDAGDVRLQDLNIRVLPVLKAEGHGLTIRHHGSTDVPPLISIARFSAEGSTSVSRR